MATKFPVQNITITPPGYNWTREKAEKAAKDHKFIRVGGKNITYRVLTGAVKRSWKKDDPVENSTIFNVDYRITGSPEDVSIALQYAGYDKNTIDGIIANSITKNNYQTTKANETAQEIEAYTMANERKPQVAPYSRELILWLAAPENIANASVVTKSGGQQGGLTMQGRSGDTLLEKVQKLPQGKIIDVSGMDLVTGKGTRTGPRLKTGRTGKFYSGEVPFMSNDIEKYKRAIEIVYGPEGLTKFAKDIEQVDLSLKRARTPFDKRVFSPKNTRLAPGANLAPQPAFKTITPGIKTLGGNNVAKVPKF